MKSQMNTLLVNHLVHLRMKMNLLKSNLHVMELMNTKSHLIVMR
jgi:hypothetical protein